MRTLIKVTLNTDKANAAIDQGVMGQEIERAMNQLQPEAAYFFGENGRRTAFFVFDMEDSSQLPVVSEPFFRFADSIQVTPVMNGDDLQKGLQQVSG